MPRASPQEGVRPQPPVVGSASGVLPAGQCGPGFFGDRS